MLVDLAYFLCRVLRADRMDAQDAHDLGAVESDCVWALDGGVERRLERLRAALAAPGRRPEVVVLLRAEPYDMLVRVDGRRFRWNDTFRDENATPPSVRRRRRVHLKAPSFS